MSRVMMTEEEERDLERTAARLVSREAPPEEVRVWDEEGRYPTALFDAIREAGWYELGMATRSSGVPVAVPLAIICEQIGRASSDLVALFNLAVSGIRDLDRNGSGSLRQAVLPKVFTGEKRFAIAVTEPDAGSDAAALKTTATPAEGGFVINGQKAYCEGGGIPGTCIEVYVRTAQTKKKSHGISAFVIGNEDEGVELRRMPTLGRNISGAYEVFFESAWVPETAMLGAPGDGWRILQDRLTLERLMVASGFIGSTSAVVDMTIAYTRERHQFGQPIATYQGVSHPIVDLYVRLDAARCAVRRTARLYDSGAPAATESVMAKLLCGQLYADASAIAMQLHGAYGYVRDHTLPMHYSDGIIATVVAGPPQVQRNVIARHLGLGARLT